jgi:hypothetical protein
MWSRRCLCTVAGVTALGAAAIGCPMVGVPLALGMAAYAAIRMSKPHAIVRGRTLSPRQQRRAAAIIGGGMLGIAALTGTLIYSLELANSLEHRLHHNIEAAYDQAEPQVGQVFEECKLFACARATIAQPSTPKTLGIARLNGFALHTQSLYHWRNPAAQTETMTAHGPEVTAKAVQSGVVGDQRLPAKMPEAM